MSVQTEIDRISTAVQNAHLKVIEKGGTSAAPYLVANLPDAIDTIPEATALDELTNPGSADTMLEGTEMLDAEGKKVTGAIPNKTADDLIANGEKVSVPAGYYAEDTEKSVNTAFLAKPSINIGADGLITASYTQWSGYVQSGTQKNTRQLSTQESMTVTPGKSGQVAVKSGKYTTGDVYVAGDSDLIPDNIKSGVSIFGVAGTMTAGEDVTAETNTYTGLLDDLEAAVDALPDAGGGGTSGGGAQAARGVITLDSDILAPNRLIADITGLGFVPKYVLIVGRATKYTLINTSISGKYRRVIYLCEHDGTTNYSGYVYQQYISATNTDGAYGKIVLNSDGFSFYTGTNSESAAFASFAYHYVAIG